MRMDKLGAPLWVGLHAATFDYPEAPAPHQKRAAIALFESLQELLPCADCRKHYTAELAAHPVRTAVDSRDTLSRWLVDLHNRVNARLGKRVVSYDEVRAQYLDCSMECKAGEGSGSGCCVPPAEPSVMRLAAGASSGGASNVWVLALVAAVLAAIIIAAIMFSGRKRK